jgi:hypothetical protein
MHGPGHGDPAVTGPGRDREQAHAAELVQRVMLGAVVHGQARLGQGAGDVAGERRQRVAGRQAAPVDADQPGYCLREFCGLGCCAQRAEIGLKEISVGHAVPP